MVESVLSRQTQGPADSASQRETHLQAFRYMLLARVLDEKLASLYRAGKIPGGGVYLGKGQEALSAAIGVQLRKGDVFAPLIRDGAGRLAFGESLLDAIRTPLGSAIGPMRGRDGNVHRGKPREGYLPMISHLGAMVSVVNGTLMAKRMAGLEGHVGVTCLGDGATSTGASHEALNQAAVEKLPLILVVADNQYAYSTPTSRQFACHSLADRAKGYGIMGHTVDGTDLTECLEIIGIAIENARGGGGPQLVVAQLLRLCGHGEHDDASYIDPSLKQSALGRDCLKVAESFILRSAWANEGDLRALKEKLAHEVDEAVAIVQREPSPDPFREGWCALASKHFCEGILE